MVFPRLTNISPRDNLHLSVRFDDGVEGVVDLSRYRGVGVFSVWDDEREWRAAKIERKGRCVTWPGGADVCGDLLHLEASGMSAEGFDDRDSVPPLSPRVSAVRALAPWKVWIRFTDGSEGIADLSDVAGVGVFKKWEDPAFWKSVYVDPESRTIAWPGGIDLCPDVLYHEVTGKPLPGWARETDAA